MTQVTVDLNDEVHKKVASFKIDNKDCKTKAEAIHKMLEQHQMPMEIWIRDVNKYRFLSITTIGIFLDGVRCPTIFDKDYEDKK